MFQPCECDLLGSLTEQCDVITGTCSCRAGVSGSKCHTCQRGYWELSENGCQQCQCDDVGALSSVCNVTTGQCPCKVRLNQAIFLCVRLTCVVSLLKLYTHLSYWNRFTTLSTSQQWRRPACCFRRTLVVWRAVPARLDHSVWISRMISHVYSVSVWA